MRLLELPQFVEVGEAEEDMICRVKTQEGDAVRQLPVVQQLSVNIVYY